MDLTDDISTYVNRIERLEADLIHECTISTRVATLIGPKPEDIPVLDNFDGTRADLHPFLTKLRIKIAGNTTRYPDIQHQLWYVFGFLNGDTYATIEPHLINDRLNFDCHTLISLGGHSDI